MRLSSGPNALIIASACLLRFARVLRAAIADSPESPVAAQVFARQRRFVCGSSGLQTRGRRSFAIIAVFAVFAVFALGLSGHSSALQKEADGGDMKAACLFSPPIQVLCPLNHIQFDVCVPFISYEL